jgi:hypothetical protein
MLEKGCASRLERIGVRLEFLPNGVALALQRFARGERQAEQVGDCAVDRGDDGITPIEIACLAGPERGNADVVGDFGRAALRVDPGNEVGAKPGRKEIADDEQLEPGIRNALDSGRRRQPGARPCRIRACRQAPGSFHAG